MNHGENRLRLVFLVLLTLLVAGVGRPGTRAQSPSQAGLVVQFGDGAVITRCVEFGESQISGYDVLLRSGLNFEASVGGMGAFICRIEDEGCPATNCMCAYPPDYWSYWRLVEGEWNYSQVGVSGSTVRPGDVEGWSWMAGSPPAVIPLEEICALPATDTPTPTPSDTPSPTATWTPTAIPPTVTAAPTDAPPPTATAAPTDTPPPTATDVPMATATDVPMAAATDVPMAAATDVSTATPMEPATSLPTPTTTVKPAPSLTPVVATPTEDLPGDVTVTTIPTPTPTMTATMPPLDVPTAESAIPPTQTAVPISVATGFPSGEQAATSPSQEEAPVGTGKVKYLITILSVGAGAACLFFGLFVALLVAVLVVFGLRQR